MTSSKTSRLEKRPKGAKSAKSPSKSSKQQKKIRNNDEEKESKKKNPVSNGNASDNGVVIVPSSSTESQQVEEEDDHEKRSKTRNNPTGNTKYEKGKRKKSEDEDESEGKEEVENAKTHIFPMERIKRMIRSKGSNFQTSNEALFVINKATEKFLERYAQDAYAYFVRDHEKTIGCKHLSSVLDKQKRFHFLSEKKAKEVTRERKSPNKTSKESKKINLKGKTRNHLCNGNVSDNDILIVPSSSTESQQVEKEHEEEVKRTRTSQSKTGKRRRADDIDEYEVEEKEDAKTHKFPMNRIKTIIKGQDSEIRMSTEALFVINKATEKFLERFTQDAYARSVEDHKKSLAYTHLSSVVSKQKKLNFLSDFVPEKVKAEDVLKEKNLAGTWAR